MIRLTPEEKAELERLTAAHWEALLAQGLSPRQRHSSTISIHVALSLPDSGHEFC